MVSLMIICPSGEPLPCRCISSCGQLSGMMEQRHMQPNTKTLSCVQSTHWVNGGGVASHSIFSQDTA